jgi:hypothetical protein
VTDEHTADETTALLLKLPGMVKTSVIVDGTACIGGNTLSFAKKFEHVLAIELNHSRCKMLKHNVDVVKRHSAAQSSRHGGGGPGGSKLASGPVYGTGVGRVDVREGNFLAVIQGLDQLPVACVFLDPPWGGLAYKDQATVPLSLGEFSLAEVCGQLLGMNHMQSLQYILLKVPFNYDQAGLQATCKQQGCAIKMQSLSKKVKLLVVSRRARGTPQSTPKHQPKQQPKQKANEQQPNAAERPAGKTFAIRVKKRKR